MAVVAIISCKVCTAGEGGRAVMSNNIHISYIQILTQNDSQILVFVNVVFLETEYIFEKIVGLMLGL